MRNCPTRIIESTDPWKLWMPEINVRAESSNINVMARVAIEHRKMTPPRMDKTTRVLGETAQLITV